MTKKIGITKDAVMTDRAAINGKKDSRKGKPLRRAVDAHYPDSEMKRSKTSGIYSFSVEHGKQVLEVDIHVSTLEDAKKIVTKRYTGAKITYLGKKITSKKK